MRVEGALGSTWEASPSAVWLSEITDRWPSVTGLPIAVLPRGLLWHVPRGFAGLGERRIGDLLALWSKASQDGEPQAQLRGVLAKDAGQVMLAPKLSASLPGGPGPGAPCVASSRGEGWSSEAEAQGALSPSAKGSGRDLEKPTDMSQGPGWCGDK